MKKVINEEAFVNFYATCAPETYGNLAKQVGGLALGYKIRNGHVKRTDASIYEQEDSERVFRFSLGLLKAIKWANKHASSYVTMRQISWEDDNIIGIEELALDIYTDIVTSEQILSLFEDRKK